MGPRETIRLILVGVIVSVFSVCITTLFLQSNPQRSTEGFQVREISSSRERIRSNHSPLSVSQYSSLPKRDVDFSYYILHTNPIPQVEGDQFNGTSVIMLNLDEKGEGGKRLEMRVDVTVQPTKNGRTIGVRRGFQDLLVYGVDPVSRHDIESLRTYTTPTFLYKKTVIDVNSNGYLALEVLFGGAVQHFTFLHTSSETSLPSKQKSMVDDVLAKHDLRDPWPTIDDVIDPSADLCNIYKADLVIVNDFVNFARGFPSLAAAVAALRCITNQILLVQVDTINVENFTMLAKTELFQQFADLQELPTGAVVPQRNWFVAHTKPFSRPASSIDIRRGKIDPPTFLQRLGTKYPYLGFQHINPALFAPRCTGMRDTTLNTVITDKIHEDAITMQTVATCIYVYNMGNETAFTKISSSDFAAREHWFINKMYEVDPKRAALFVPKSWAPFVDDLTGASSSCIAMMQGVPLQSATLSDEIYDFNDFLQFSDDAVEILYLLHKSGIVHRDLRDANLMVMNNRRLAVFDFMYSVADDMPFSGFTPDGLGMDSYPFDYAGHCDIKAIAGVITHYFQSHSGYLAVLTMELNAQAINSCTLDYERLREILTKLWDDLNFFF